MKKSVKVFLIIFIILVIVILIDAIQAKIFDNRPFIKITENYNGVNLYQKDKGIFVYSYTKIGHIENLPNLGDKNITIKFET